MFLATLKEGTGCSRKESEMRKSLRSFLYTHHLTDGAGVLLIEKGL